MSAAQTLREMSESELAKKEQDLRQELFNLRFQNATRQLENVMRIRSVRRDIARVMTILNEKRRSA